MNRQEFFRNEYRKRRPEWRDSLTVYRELISQYVGPETRLLDIGCGHADWLADIYGRTPHTYGLDPDADALAKNTIIKNKSVGIADHLPFADDFFDLITSAWVF